MDIITLLSITIFGATLITIVMALVSYSAFKLRELRQPQAGGGGRSAVLPPLKEGETLFFKKFVLPPEEPGESNA